MRLRSICLRGLTRFTSAEPVRIDFDALGPGLIALVGDNGAGKTTCLEAVPAALHRVFPSRPGSLYDYAHGRDAFVEAVFTHQRDEIKVRLAVDAERRTTEGYVFVNGASVTTGRSAEFEAEIERRFGSLALFLSSVFACQTKAGSFLQMKKADRKSLFVELLGLAYLELLHAAAKDRAGRTEQELTSAREALTVLERELEVMPRLEWDVAGAQNTAEAAAGRLDTARTEEAAALAALARARGAAERLAALEAAVESAQREVGAAQKATADALAAEQNALAQAKERLGFLNTRKVHELEPREVARHQGAMERISARRVALEEHIAGARDAVEALAELEAVSAETAAWEAQLRGLDEARRRVATAQAAYDIARERHHTAFVARGKEMTRLEHQAEMLDKAPCGAKQLWDGNPLAGTCPLLAEARQARLQMEGFSDDLPEAGAEAAQLTTLADAQAVYAPLSTAAGTIDGQDVKSHALRKRRLGAEQALARAQAVAGAKDQLRALVGEADAELTQHQEQMTAAQEAISVALAEAAQIEVGCNAEMRDAQTKQAAAQNSLRGAADRLGQARLALELARAQTESVGTAEVSATAARLTRESAERALRDADQLLARVRAALEQVQARQAQLEPLRAAQARALMHLGDWSMLAKALGKDGVQALEIDAAGPEVAHITNELLESCYGPRFAISFETLREKKSARGEYAEAFDITVLDAGAERPVESLSGGEKVVIGEALGLAISILNARKSGIRYETLWRDETAGALDPENAARYVLMMRRARELGGFHQVVFVSHSPEVWESADVRLEVAGGTVKVAA